MNICAARKGLFILLFLLGLISNTHTIDITNSDIGNDSDLIFESSYIPNFDTDNEGNLNIENSYTPYYPNNTAEDRNLVLNSHLPINKDPIKNFSGPYNPMELNSYNFTSRLDLLGNQYDLVANLFGAYTYIADMLTDDLGNLYVLGGYEPTYVDSAS